MATGWRLGGVEPASLGPGKRFRGFFRLTARQNEFGISYFRSIGRFACLMNPVDVCAAS